MEDIDKILEDLAQVERAMPSEQFLKRMENVAVAYVVARSQMSKTTVLAIAASFALLLTANIWIWNEFQSTTTESTTLVETDYDLIPTKSIYYE
ncbi:MAG: hypothetical protein AAF806_33360 [Bacteroidota bacterium]